MKGFFTPGEKDFQAGFDEGEKAGRAIMFHLTIKVHDIDLFLNPLLYLLGYLIIAIRQALFA